MWPKIIFTKSGTSFTVVFNYEKTVFPYSDLLRKTVKFRSQKMQFLYLDAQKELDAHLFTIGSPNEYYNWAKYERVTLTHIWVLCHWKFSWTLYFTKEPIVFRRHCINPVFFIEFPPDQNVEKFEMVGSYPKPLKSSYAMGWNYLDLNF